MSRKGWGGVLLLVTLLGCRQDSAPGASDAAAGAAAGADVADSSFDARPFFENAVIVTDKGEYVHILWDAQAAAKEFEGRERRGRLALAAAQLVLDRLRADAASDLVKVDIVFVKVRDEYGKPKWDSLQKLAHVEVRTTRLKEQAHVADGRVTHVSEGAFDRLEVFAP